MSGGIWFSCACNLYESRLSELEHHVTDLDRRHDAHLEHTAELEKKLAKLLERVDELERELDTATSRARRMFNRMRK